MSQKRYVPNAKWVRRLNRCLDAYVAGLTATTDYSGIRKRQYQRFWRAGMYERKGWDVPHPLRHYIVKGGIV